MQLEKDYRLQGERLEVDYVLSKSLQKRPRFCLHQIH